MDYACVEDDLRESYNQRAERYRLDDEREIQSPDHADLRDRLQQITSYFGRPIDVLEVGCGTGRYFHCLRNVKSLLGVDVSPEMLQAARNPVLHHLISAEEIQLVCGSVYRQDYPGGSFDFIYALGVFGNGCGLTEDLCQKFFTWLKPGGCLFFDTFDIAAEPLLFRLKHKGTVAMHRLFPAGVRQRFRRKASVPFFIPSKPQLHRLVAKTFPAVQVRSKACQTVVGPGRKLQCIALKADQVPRSILQGFL